MGYRLIWQYTLPARQPPAASKHRLQPLAVQQTQQLQRWPARVLFTALLFPHGRQAGVQHGGQYRLAQLQVVTQCADFFAVVVGHGLKTKRIELVLVAFVDGAEAMKVSR